MKFIKNCIPELLHTFSALGLAGIGLFKAEIETSILKDYFLWLFFLFIAIAIAATIFGVNRRRSEKTNTDLVKENRALRGIIEDGTRNYFDIWDDKARTIFQTLDCDIKSRLSVYKFDNVGKIFLLIGRYSENASYRERGRATYPSDEGVIGIAWETGEYYCSKLPSFANNPEKYITESEKKFKLPRATVEKMQMKSRSIYAKNIKDSNGIPTAVIVIESIQREAFNAESLKLELEDSHDQDINETLESLKSIEPSLKIAKELGL